MTTDIYQPLIIDSKKILHYSEDLDKGITFPSLYSYSRGKFDLRFIAANHSSDIHSPTHQMIEAQFAAFKPEAVIIEGMSTHDGPTWDDTIEQYFLKRANAMKANTPTQLPEPYFTLLEANKQGKRIYSGEPSECDNIKDLISKGYKADDDYCCFSVLLEVCSLSCYPANGKLEDIWQRNYNSFQTKLTNHLSFSVESFYSWFKQKTNEQFVIEKVTSQYIAPGVTKPFGSINHLAGTLSRFRDQTILETIGHSLQDNERVLVVYGGSHHSTLRPALEAMFLYSKTD